MDWTKWQDKAASMIGNYGADITVRLLTRSGYSAASDTYATIATTDYVIKGLITNYDEADIDGTIIQNGDRRVLIYAKGLPALESSVDEIQIIYGGIAWNPISIVPLKPGGTTILYYLQCRGSSLAGEGPAPLPVAVQASGGVETEAGGYKIHTFLASGNFVVTVGGAVDVLVVAGGGGASIGGGGGGGVIISLAHTLATGTFPVTVGNGGIGAWVFEGGGDYPTNGGDSKFDTFTAKGGGGGGHVGVNGLNGGSGGGAGGGVGLLVGGEPVAGQGYAGGSNLDVDGQWPSGGGGGAGAVGGDVKGPTSGGDGGDGVSSSVSGVATYYGGGGGGASFSGGGGAGGLGGGGTGAAGPAGSGVSGTVNTGGGGGGAINRQTGGNGGKGIVIIRYEIDP